MLKQQTFSGGSVDFGAASIYITFCSGRRIWRQWQTQMLACGLWLSKSFKPQSGRPLTSLNCIAGDCCVVAKCAVCQDVPQVKPENPATMPESDDRISAICITVQEITPLPPSLPSPRSACKTPHDFWRFSQHLYALVFYNAVVYVAQQ